VRGHLGALQLRGTSGTPADAVDASEMTAVGHPADRTLKRRRVRLAAWIAVAAAGLALAGCGNSAGPFAQVYQRGYIVPEGALEQVPLGSSQEQVLIVLGTPSTVATVSGEAFYYISQRAVQQVAFTPQRITNQRVLAVYFDKNRRVERIADYGLKDGKVFDFISRTTPASGAELNYLGYIFSIARPLGS